MGNKHGHSAACCDEVDVDGRAHEHVVDMSTPDKSCILFLWRKNFETRPCLVLDFAKGEKKKLSPFTRCLERNLFMSVSPRKLSLVTGSHYGELL